MPYKAYIMQTLLFSKTWLCFFSTLC